MNVYFAIIETKTEQYWNYIWMLNILKYKYIKIECFTFI